MAEVLPYPPQGISGGTPFLFGTLAARPAFGTINTYYWATDIFTLFRDTGAAWEVVGAQRYDRYIWDIFRLMGLTINYEVPPNIVFLVPIQIYRTLTVDRIIVINRDPSIRNRRVCIYEDNGETPAGGALIVESASVASSGNWRKQEITIANTRLVRGLYWLGINLAGWLDRFDAHINPDTRGGTLQGYSYALAYGAFTDPCPAVAQHNNPPIQGVRVASIP